MKFKPKFNKKPGMNSISRIEHRTMASRVAIAVRAIVSSISVFGALVTVLSFNHAGYQDAQQASNSDLPVILAQPSNHFCAPNSRTSFSVAVACPSAGIYLWRINNVAIPCTTEDSHALRMEASIHEVSYTVTITNASSSVTSAPATLYLDSNENGLRDTWEQATFGNLTQTGMGNFDLDEVSNLDAYLKVKCYQEKNGNRQLLSLPTPNQCQSLSLSDYAISTHRMPLLFHEPLLKESKS